MKAKTATHARCGKWGELVRAGRMADHWIIQGHASNAGAVRVSFPLDRK